MATHHTRYVSMAKETTGYNVAATADYVGEIESEGFQQSYDVLKRNDMNYYGARAAVASKLTSEGSMSMALQPDAFTLCCIHGLFGVHSSVTATSGVIEEIGVDSTTALPSYTFRVGRDDNEHVFPGQVLESMSVSASVGEYAMVTFNTMGAKQDPTLGTLATALPTYTGDAAHFAQAYVNFEGAATSSDFSELVQSIDFEIKTNRDMDNSYGLGSETCVRAPPVTIREVSGSLTFHKALLSSEVTGNSEPYFAELLPGGSAAENVPGSATPALSALFYVDANNYIRFDFFHLVYESPESTVTGRDSQTMTVNFHALYDASASGGAAMCKVTYGTEDPTMAGGGTPIDFDTV